MLHHSRHTATGSGEHHISPASGLIIDRYVQTGPMNSPAFWGDK